VDDGRAFPSKTCGTRIRQTSTVRVSWWSGTAHPGCLEIDDFDHLPGSPCKHRELIGRPCPADAIPLLLGCTISSYKCLIFNRECTNSNIWKWGAGVTKQRRHRPESTRTDTPCHPLPTRPSSVPPIHEQRRAESAIPGSGC